MIRREIESDREKGTLTRGDRHSQTHKREERERERERERNGQEERH